MKSRRTLFALVLLVVLAGALAWRFWPDAEPVDAAPAKSAQPVSAKMASTPVNERPAATTPARVAMPAAPTVAPMPTWVRATPSLAANDAPAIPAQDADAVIAGVGLLAKQAAIPKLTLVGQMQGQLAISPSANAVGDTALATLAAEQANLQAQQMPMEQMRRWRQQQAEEETALDETETDWGEIQVADGVPIELTTSSGDQATLTPKVLPDGTIRMQLEIQYPQHPGEMEVRANATDLAAKPGQSVSVILGGRRFKMTPKL